MYFFAHLEHFYLTFYGAFKQFRGLSKDIRTAEAFTSAVFLSKSRLDAFLIILEHIESVISALLLEQLGVASLLDYPSV